VTAINIFADEFVAKCLELLREQVPEATRVAVLVNPANPATAETTARDVQAAARGIGSQVELLDASTSREIDGAFATAFCSRTARRTVRGRRPAFRTPAITI